MSRSPLAALMLVVAVSVAAIVMNATGRWVGTVSTPNGDFELVFNFKVEGQTLTGGLSTPQGDVPISDGRVRGDSLSFTLSFGDFNIPHRGVVKGDTMTLTSPGMEGGQNTLVLTRAKAE